MHHEIICMCNDLLLFFGNKYAKGLIPYAYNKATCLPSKIALISIYITAILIDQVFNLTDANWIGGALR